MSHNFTHLVNYLVPLWSMAYIFSLNENFSSMDVLFENLCISISNQIEI